MFLPFLSFIVLWKEPSMAAVLSSSAQLFPCVHLVWFSLPFELSLFYNFFGRRNIVSRNLMSLLLSVQQPVFFFLITHPIWYFCSLFSIYFSFVTHLLFYTSVLFYSCAYLVYVVTQSQPELPAWHLADPALCLLSLSVFRLISRPTSLPCLGQSSSISIIFLIMIFFLSHNSKLYCTPPQHIPLISVTIHNLNYLEFVVKTHVLLH